MYLEVLMCTLGAITFILAIKWLCETNNAGVDPIDYWGFKDKNLVTDFEKAHLVHGKLSERISCNRKASYISFLVWIFSMAFLVTLIIYQTRTPEGG